MEKPEIQYPCDWSYKIIGSDGDYITRTIPTLLGDFNYRMSKSNQSKTGKFISFNCSVHVSNEEERTQIFAILQNLPSVRMVL